MEYGHTTDITGIDFTLPPDHATNASFLQTLNIEHGTLNIRVGCAKWGIKEWVGPLYPKGTKESQYLEEYGKRFNSVELNTTGYRFGSARVMKEWADKTPEGFTFSPKFPQSITQFKLLGDVQELTERFVESINGFEDKLGMPFLLLPERFTLARIDKIEAFFEKIPQGFPVAFELRHPEFYSEENKIRVAEILRKHNSPWIISDTAGERGVIHQVITSETVFIRFSGCDTPDVDKQRLNDWVARIMQWHALGIRNVYWYAHNIPEEKTPIYAAYFLKELNAKMGLSLAVPEVPLL
jgi:uncharacterized protein YecE (DUF72 family)